MSATAENGDEDVVVTATESAAEQARELMDGEGMDPSEAGLRLYVQQGGCAGLSYGMRFEHEPEPEDRVFESNGLRLFVDQSSLSYVGGSRLDFEGGLQGEGFHVQNPNVEAECGCGESFRT
jgi:iron-sulfur cluster assembly protein